MSEIWGDLSLPTWDDDALERLYALFRKNQAAEGVLHPVEDDRFVRLLMCVIELCFKSRQYVETLPRAQLDPQDVAQLTVMHLRRKAHSIRMTKGEGPRVMLGGMHTTIDRHVLSAIAGRSRKGRREMTATDYAGDHVEHGEAAEVPSPVVAPAPAAAQTEPALVRSLRVCRGAATIDVWHGERKVARRLYDFLVSSLLTERGIVPHAKLPDKLKGRVSRELHGLVASRINRLVRDYAE